MPKLTKRGRGKSLVGYILEERWQNVFYKGYANLITPLIRSKKEEQSIKVRITIQEIPITERRGR